LEPLDGATLSYRHPRSGEWAHDVRDPLRESMQVSVEPAWELRPVLTGQRFASLEVGFGRGLNTASLLRKIRTEQIEPSWLQLDGCEANPAWLHPWPELPSVWQGCAPWWGRDSGVWPLDRPAGQARVYAESAPACLEIGASLASEPVYDWIFLDLFSPGGHPEEWHPGLLEALTAVALPGAVLTSYTCARQVRDALDALGWAVERLRRPGIRDTLRAQLAPSAPRS
jgi:tRNA 5-methylaminomethyl-2-thiouridine biosynthesis bifunctional protein